MVCCFRFNKYECIQQRAIRNRPMLLSFRNSAVGDIVLNALLTSNSKATVISFLSRPDLTSSVILSKAVVVLWCLRKPVRYIGIPYIRESERAVALARGLERVP